MSTCQDEDNIFLNCKDEENIFPNFLSVGLLSHCSIQCDCRQPIVWSLESERPQNRYLLVKTITILYLLKVTGDQGSLIGDDLLSFLIFLASISGQTPRMSCRLKAAAAV